MILIFIFNEKPFYKNHNSFLKGRQVQLQWPDFSLVSVIGRRVCFITVKTWAQSLFYPGALQNTQGVNIHQMNKTHDVKLLCYREFSALLLHLTFKIYDKAGVYLGEGNGNSLQYSCLENPMDGGAWWATVLGVAKGRTWLSDFTFTLNNKQWHIFIFNLTIKTCFM